MATNSLTVNAIMQIKTQYCKEFFEDFKVQPDEMFAAYYHAQQEDILKSRGLKPGTGDNSYRPEKVSYSQIDTDKSLVNQDRRDLDPYSMLREQTFQSFTGNIPGTMAPALVLRKVAGEAYQFIDGRHTGFWAMARGNTKANAWIVDCSDEVLELLRMDFNNHNGAQRTEEERFYSAYGEWLRGNSDGTKSSIKAVAEEWGISPARFSEFTKRQEACNNATQAGLVVQKDVDIPPVFFETVINKINNKQITLEKAQEIYDKTVAEDKTPKSSAKKAAKVAATQLKAATTKAEIEKATNDFLQGKRPGRKIGQSGKALRVKLAEDFDDIGKITAKGSPNVLGITNREIIELRIKGTNFLNWLDSK